MIGTFPLVKYPTGISVPLFFGSLSERRLPSRAQVWLRLLTLERQLKSEFRVQSSSSI